MRCEAGTLPEDGGSLSVGGERARVGGSVCSEENTFVCELLHCQVILGASISSHVIQRMSSCYPVARRTAWLILLLVGEVRNISGEYGDVRG